MAKFNRLFISEKASSGKTLAEYMAKSTGKQLIMHSTYAQVGDDTFAYMSGHLYQLVESHAYEPRFEKWNLNDLPIIPAPFRLTPRIDPKTKSDSSARAKIELIRKLLADCTSVVGFGDPDAEGQLLQDQLLIQLGNKKPVMRLWSNALDDSTLGKALVAMKPNEEFVGWYEDALSRSQADWLYGINMTRACTIHARNAGSDTVVTVGRVQTPALALVVVRELEIKVFKPVDYYVPHIGVATEPGFRATWQPKKDAEGNVDDPRVDIEARLLDKNDADTIASGARTEGSATVVSVDTKAGTEAAPLPFSLSSLQSHCSKQYGFSAKQTLDIAQSLYTKKITSYPRVDCDFLPESQHAEAPRILVSLSKAHFPTAFTAALLGAKPALKSRAWNDAKVTAHHAIVPMHIDSPGDIARLDDLEAKVYYEIVKRYILQFWPVAKFNATEVILSCGPNSAEEAFSAKGRRYTDDGWRKAFALVRDDDESEAPATLPNLVKGASLKLASVGVDAVRTKPPKRFTDGTLISAMKNIHQFVKDPEFRRRLKEGAGIGTEATRGSIIEGLLKRGYLFMKGKEFVPSEAAISFITSLPDSMTTPDMTAMWQQFNDDVRARRSTHQAFIAKMVPWVTTLVQSSSKFFSGNQFTGSGQPSKPRIIETEHTCFGEYAKTGCGAKLKHIPGVQGKYKSFFGCSNGDCKKTFTDVGGKPVERNDVANEQPGAPKYQCKQCKTGFMRRVARRENAGFFWGCGNFKEGCKGSCNDLDGVPDLEGKSSQQQPAKMMGSSHSCPICSDGSLLQRARKDKSGYFWGCSAWQSGCKGAFNDVNGSPDIEGKTKQGSQGSSGKSSGGRTFGSKLSTPSARGT